MYFHTKFGHPATYNMKDLCCRITELGVVVHHGMAQRHAP